MPKYYAYHQYEIEEYLATPMPEPSLEWYKNENKHLQESLARLQKIVGEHRERCEAAYERGFNAACTVAYMMGWGDGVNHHSPALNGLTDRVRQRKQEIYEKAQKE